ncbi:riboflavin kinase [uncultured Rikenella sp.]|uniref:riboflavin kinase n=1 Tax=uncultured Rikenella sp. TaxID=368003 RepID=UPI00272B78E7|nr:riboflavin kinase [uncultured Rikenella sp.]
MQKRHTIRGTVTTGRRLGRTLGFPTANIELAATDRSRDKEQNGVWLARAAWDDDDSTQRRWALVNIGTAPTVTREEKTKAEAWLFDFSGDLYGRELRLDLLRYLRPERKFASVEELRQAMEEDKENALNIIAQDEFTL